MNKSLGQYFTTHEILLEKVYQLIKNNPQHILEPSVGRGHIVDYIQRKIKNCNFKMIEIDKSLNMLSSINKNNLIYSDFLNCEINETFDTVIGNPPFVKKKGGNLYIRFIDKCIDLLNEKGELIFIIPSDFFKVTSASKTLHKMMDNGYFSHIFHPHDEHLFKHASIDVLVFRYVKSTQKQTRLIYNNETKYVHFNDGIINFENSSKENILLLKNYFDVYVGMVSGCDSILKNQTFGNELLLVEKDKQEKYIFVNNINEIKDELKDYLYLHKNKLIQRKVRKIDESNWFEFGLPRNKKNIDLLKGKSAIFIHNISRKDQVAFKSIVQYFSGNLIMIVPKEKYEKKINLDKYVDYFNSDEFKNKYMYSNRFKITHKNMMNSILPDL